MKIGEDWRIRFYMKFAIIFFAIFLNFNLNNAKIKKMSKKYCHCMPSWQNFLPLFAINDK